MQFRQLSKEEVRFLLFVANQNIDKHDMRLYKAFSDEYYGDGVSFLTLHYRKDVFLGTTAYDINMNEIPIKNGKKIQAAEKALDLPPLLPENKSFGDFPVCFNTKDFPKLYIEVNDAVV